MHNSNSLMSFLVDFLIDKIDIRDRYIIFVMVPVKPSLHRSSTPQKLLSEFNRFYIRFCRKLIGRNFHRKIHLQPKLVAAFDRIGSKRDATRPDRYDACPHLHTVISFDPSIWRSHTDIDIESFISEAMVKSHFFEQPHIKSGGCCRLEIRKQLNYAMKDAYVIDGGSDVDDMSWDFWPRRT